MGEEPTGAGVTPEELAYYRTIEDRFGQLRGTPFLFRPKDFSLLRTWWTNRVPLAAVLAGMQEVFDRRRESGGEPVSSLAYCRHAIARHAKRLAPIADAPVAPPAGDALARLAAEVRVAAVRWTGMVGVVTGLESLAKTLETLPAEADPAALEDALGRLEAGALEGLVRVLPDEAAAGIAVTVAAAMQGVGEGTDAATRARMERAVRLRAVRECLGLPRMELSDHATDH